MLDFPATKYVLEAICLIGHTHALSWVVDFHDEFVPEYDELDQDVQDELLAIIEVIKQEGSASRKATRGYNEWLQIQKHEGDSL